MAVAMDSHRDFLIPEYTANTIYPTTNTDLYSDALRLFLCIWYYITDAELFQYPGIKTLRIYRPLLTSYPRYDKMKS